MEIINQSLEKEQFKVSSLNPKDSSTGTLSEGEFKTRILNNLSKLGNVKVDFSRTKVRYGENSITFKVHFDDSDVLHKYIELMRPTGANPSDFYKFIFMSGMKKIGEESIK